MLLYTRFNAFMLIINGMYYYFRITLLSIESLIVLYATIDC